MPGAVVMAIARSKPRKRIYKRRKIDRLISVDFLMVTRIEFDSFIERYTEMINEYSFSVKERFVPKSSYGFTTKVTLYADEYEKANKNRTLLKILVNKTRNKYEYVSNIKEIFTKEGINRRYTMETSIYYDLENPKFNYTNDYVDECIEE